MKIFMDKISIEKSEAVNPLFIKPILEGMNPHARGDEKVCIRCGVEIKKITTVSKIWGEISVYASECDACKNKDYESHREEEKREDFEKNIYKCCGYQNRPSKHLDKTVALSAIKEGYKWQKDFLNYIFDVCTNGLNKGAFVYGNTGSGKTFIAKVMHNELLSQNLNSCFIKAVDLAIVLRKETFSKDDYRKVLSQFKNVDTLIVDDYGTQKNTEFVKEAMFSIFDYRYENSKRTVITTNLDNEDIQKHEPRLYSRIMDRDWMKPFKFTSYDLRV